MNTLFAGLLSCLLTTAITTLSYSQEYKWGNTVVIDKPVYKDLYLSGGKLVINAPVYGDLVVAGGMIEINDSVTTDILVAGGEVYLNGYVGDDVRCAGGKVRVGARVAGDLVVTGGTVVIGSMARVSDLLAAGGDITSDGRVEGAVQASAGILHLNGVVLGNCEAKAGDLTIGGVIHGRSLLSATDKLIIGEKASFMSPVRYWVPFGKVHFRQSLRGGAATFDETLQLTYDKWYFLGFATILGLLWYLGMGLLLIIILQYLFGKVMREAGARWMTSPWRSLGLGLSLIIGIPVLAAIAFITIIGFPVAVLLMVLYLVSVLLSIFLVSLLMANAYHRQDVNKRFWKVIATAFIVFILLNVFRQTPYLGWIVGICLVATAWGSIAGSVRWRKLR